MEFNFQQFDVCFKSPFVFRMGIFVLFLSKILKPKKP